MSSNRFAYGRFEKENFGDRIKALAASAASGDVSSESLLDDFVYRYDGNSFGAMIQEKQSAGYGVTGLPQIAATVSYMIPSFINTSKLDLDEYLRNEESYDVEFYSLPDKIDYLSDFWTLLLGYTGPYLLPFLAVLLGFLTALLDNWLARNTSALAYIVGIWGSSIPAGFEAGPSVLLFTFRAFSIILVIVLLVSRKRRSVTVPLSGLTPAPGATAR